MHLSFNLNTGVFNSLHVDHIDAAIGVSGAGSRRGTRTPSGNLKTELEFQILGVFSGLHENKKASGTPATQLLTQTSANPTDAMFFGCHAVFVGFNRRCTE